MGIKSGPNEFMIRGLYGGRNPSIKKYSSKHESWDVQTNFVLDIRDLLLEDGESSSLGLDESSTMSGGIPKNHLD